jgi:hypothetical protein
MDQSTPDRTDASLGKRPLYAVLFDSFSDVDAAYSPLIVGVKPKPIIEEAEAVTVPHGLARDMAQALPGLWYCMHLPNVFHQIGSILYESLSEFRGMALDHCFFFAPAQIFNRDYVVRWPTGMLPTLAVCPDNVIERVRRGSEELGFALPAVPYSELSDESLTRHWHSIHNKLVPRVPYFRDNIRLTRRQDLAPTSFPDRWLRRQLGLDVAERVDISSKDLIRSALITQASLSAFSRAETQDIQEAEAYRVLSEMTREELMHLSVPLTIAVPGISTAYTRKVYSAETRRRIKPLPIVDVHDTWSTEIASRTDDMVERATIELLVAHHATARTGVGIMLPSIPQQAFTEMAEIEKHFSTNANGTVVKRLLDRLDAALAARLPIAYRPLNPLSRAIQDELTVKPAINLGQGFSVLVVECIDPSDPVGIISRIAWNHVKEFVETGGYFIEFNVAETLSPETLRATVDEYQPAILVISAHGTYTRGSNLAGLTVGNTICLGPELGDLPPVVILSACHVAPRGVGAVTITDLLLRQGALAVLGTQVPVDVTHNAILMSRLFLYLAENLTKRETFSTLLDAWHHVQVTNAVHDVIDSNNLLQNWGYRGDPEDSPIAKFKLDRSLGRIRRGHLYSDTEAVLGEIAGEQGVGDKVRNWFRNPGYVPESLFYVFAGAPDSIYLHDPDSMA